MRILFVILTCEKTEQSAKLQKDNWLKFISETDSVVYLDDSFCDSPGYNNVAQKYIKFIYSFPFFGLYDWVFFCDDDTFVFPKKLKHTLLYFNANNPIMIGRTGQYDGVKYCSGGAGFAVSRALIKDVKAYLAPPQIQYNPNSDTSFGLWAKNASPELQIIDRVDQFQTQNLSHDDNALIDIDSCVTFHYCTADDYKILSKKLRYSI